MLDCYPAGSSSAPVATTAMPKRNTTRSGRDVLLALADAVGAVSIAHREHPFPHPYRSRRHLDQFVFGNPLQRSLQAHFPGRSQNHILIPARGANVGQFLFTTGIDIEVRRMGMFADDHSFVDGYSRPIEERPAILNAEQRIGDRLPD